MRPWNLSYRTKLGDSLLSPQVPFTFFPHTNFWKALATLALSMGPPPTPPRLCCWGFWVSSLSWFGLLANSLFSNPSTLQGSFLGPGHALPWPHISLAPNKSPIHTPRNVPTTHPLSEAKHYQGSFDASSATLNNQICSFVFFLFFILTKTY